MAGEVKFPIQEASPPTVAAPTARNDLAVQGGSARILSQLVDCTGAVVHTCSSSTVNVSHWLGSAKTYRRLEGPPCPALYGAKSCAVGWTHGSSFPAARSRATSSGVDRRR